MSAASSWAGKGVERDDGAAEAARHRVCAGGVAVGDEHGAHALGGERLGGQLARLPGADDHDVAVLEVAHDVGGEVHGDGRDAGPAAGDRGLRAHALAGRQRGGEQAVGHRAGDPGLERELVGAAHLALDLALADDHRLEAGGDAEQLAGGVAVARRVDDLGQLGRPDPGAVGEPPEHGALGGDRIADDQVQLGAVAGRDRRRLADARAARPPPAGTARPRCRSAPGARAARPARSCARRRAAAARSRRRLLLGGQLDELALDAGEADGHDREVDEDAGRRTRGRRRARTRCCRGPWRRRGSLGRRRSAGDDVVAEAAAQAPQLPAHVLGGHLVAPERQVQQRHAEQRDEEHEPHRARQVVRRAEHPGWVFCCAIRTTMKFSGTNAPATTAKTDA